MTLAPSTDAHVALGKATKSLAQSAISGRFGDARQHLHTAMLSSPDQIRSRLEEIDERCNACSAPIKPDGHSVDRIGAQALAGIVCAKLLSNATYAGSQPNNLGTSLSDWAGTAAGDALIGKLVECESKDEVRKQLVDFVDMFKLGDLPLPKGRVPLLDEARSALEYCESFFTSSAGRVISMPNGGLDLVSARPMDSAEYEARWDRQFVA
ncbi:hypothetical protein [Stenotrophomonas sp.]|uniref:hypothetical protein n=1 Tax=Stenotrophomonas sp. TaxID=69392 RepID=UPI0028AC9DB5|nr:hypothetical protein [Stenotrophomonas sp.]